MKLSSTLSLCACLISPAVFANTPTISVVTDLAGSIEARDPRPALTGKVFAFRGRDASAVADAIFVGSLGVSNPIPMAIVTQHQSAPNAPSRKLDYLFSPGILGETVLITGGASADKPIGLYAFKGGSLSTIVDCPEIGGPHPRDVVTDGASWASGSLTGSPSAGWKDVVPVGAVMPDGATIADAVIEEETSIGGGLAVFAVRTSRAGATVTEPAVYTYGGEPVGLKAILSADSPSPHPDRKFTAFRSVDTDGSIVSFIAAESSTGSDEMTGVFSINAAAAPNAKPTPVALAGDESPTGGRYTKFFHAATDGGTIYFDASIATGASTSYALLAARGNSITPLLVSNQPIVGGKIAGASFGAASVDGTRILVNATLTDGSSALVLIDTAPVCRADMTRDGSVGIDDLVSFIAAWVNLEPAADFDADGEVSKPDIFAYLSLYTAGCR